jgi:hypothetical protein
MLESKIFQDDFINLEQINLWQKEQAANEEKLKLLIQQKELKEQEAVNEVNRIDAGLTQLRIMKGNEKQWCEILEFGEWNRISATKLHQLSFDKTINDWLNQHYYSTVS